MESQLLHKVGQLLDVLERTTGEPGELTSTLRHIAETAQRFFTLDGCVIYAINPITSRFVESLTIEDDLVESATLFKQPRLEGITQKVLQQGMLLVERLEESSEYCSSFTRAKGIQAFVGLTLYMKYGQKPLGVLYLDFKDPQHFSSDDHELFQLFAGQASYILQETWLVWRYREVARIGQEINQELATAEVLFQKLQQHVTGILDVSYTLLLAMHLSPTNMLKIHIYEEGETFVYNNLVPTGAIQYVIEKQQTFFGQHMSREEKEKQLPFQRVLMSGTRERESVIFVPMVLRGVSLGALSIQHPEPNVYNKEDRFILELLGNHIALALYNMRLYDSLYHLNETGQFLTQQINSAQVLQETVDKIWRGTKADSVILYPYDATLQRFELPPRVAGVLLDSTPLYTTFLQPYDIAVRALNYAKPLFAKQGVSIYATLRDGLQVEQVDFQQREKVESVAVIPLHVGEVSVGVLFLNFRQPQHFDIPQKLLIEGLTHYAAIAIKNAQAFGALSQRRISELEILQNINHELSHTLELETVLNTILSLGREHVPAEEASILLHESQTHTLETKAAIGRYAEASLGQVISLQETKAITRWVVEHKKSVCAHNVREEVPWRDLYLPVVPDILSELDVPMLDGDEVIGVLNFKSTREGAFGKEEELFLITLAGQAMLAIKKAQAYEREKRFAEEGAVLSQISKEISKEIIDRLDIKRVFNLILEKALELTKSTNGALILYDPNQKGLWMAAERGVREANRSSMITSLDEGVVGYVARTKQPLNVDPSQSPWKEIYLDYIPGTRSELVVPMLAGEELHGVLNVESPILGNFKQADERVLIALADLAVVALQNAQAFESEKHSAAESQVLNEISQEIAIQVDPVYLFHLMLKKVLELTRTTIGSLHLYDPDLRDLYIAAEYGSVEEKQGQRQILGQGIVGYAALEKQWCNVDDISQPPWNEIYIENFPGVCSELAVPMLEGNELRGVLNVESPVTKHFNERDVRLLQGLADLAVIALQNAEHYRKAEQERRRFELLYEAEQELSKVTEWEKLEQAYNIILRIAEERSQSQAMIYHYDKDTQELVMIHPSESQNVSLFGRQYLDLNINRQVAQERRAIVIHDTTDLPSHVIPGQLSDPATRSLFIMPIVFKDQYYGNLGLMHKEVGHFRGTDSIFFEGLAQQLASTIYRLETAQSRQEFEKRALSAEEMSSIGQSAFEVTHRLGNDLGLVEFYVSDIQAELEGLGVTNPFVDEKLKDIVQSVKAVLSFSKDLKKELAKLGDEKMVGEPVLISSKELLEEASTALSLPLNIEIGLEVDDPVAPVKVFRSLVADILRNLVANAIQAMPDGGRITLRVRTIGRSVALEVADTGVGIPQQKLSNIFDLFFSTKGSSGFGLWSARRNALKNRGDLKVVSQLGQGTTFQLLLPRTDSGML